MNEKIIVLRPSYIPEQSAGNHLAVDLVEAFTESGYRVEVLTVVSDDFYGLPDFWKDICSVFRVSTKLKGKTVLKRTLKYIFTSFGIYKILKKQGKDCTAIISHSMPPLMAPLAAHYGNVHKIPVIYWEHDIVSASIKSTKIAKLPIMQTVMTKLAKKLENYSEKHSDRIITVSETFRQVHLASGVSEDKVSTIYTWIDSKECYPVQKKDNLLFDKYGILRDQFVVSYCGNLGFPQNVEILIDAAKKLVNYKQIVFVIVGNGSREKEIKQHLEDSEVDNCHIYSLEPLEMVKYVYSIGDVGVLIGRKGTQFNGFPSKLWSMMGAGQAIISCFDENSILSEVVKNSGCGIALPPDDSDVLASTILDLYLNRSKIKDYSEKSRQYATTTADKTIATARFVAVVQEAISEGSKGSRP